MFSKTVHVYPGKRRVHHGVQQISALPASYAGRTRPQILRGHGSAACEEEQVEELRLVPVAQLDPVMTPAIFFRANPTSLSFGKQMLYLLL